MESASQPSPKGPTVLVTTHYLEEAEALADRLTIVHRGRVEVEGTLDEVLSKHPSTILCQLPPGEASPKDRLVGEASLTPDESGRRLEYMNSGGIGLLVTTLIRAQRSGQALRAYGLSEHYQQFFNLTRLDEAISIYDDETSAIAG